MMAETGSWSERRQICFIWKVLCSTSPRYV